MIKVKGKTNSTILLSQVDNSIKYHIKNICI